MTYTPKGGEFLVNTTTSGDQSQPNIAVLDDGSRVVVWVDQFGPQGDIKGQRYDVSGAPAGGEFAVATQTTDGQGTPFVAAINGNRFVVTWADGSGISDGSFSGAEAQIFDAAGNKVGGELHVNTQTFSSQGPNGVTRLSNGGFVITWEDVFGSGLKAQIYDAGGTRVGGEILVTAPVPFPTATVAGLSGGGFVVTWDRTSTTGADTSGTSIAAQIFDALGNKIGPEILVNTTTAGDQLGPNVETLASGGFVIGWLESGGADSIRAQMFDAAGGRIGGEITADAVTMVTGFSPSVGALSNGGFVLTWTENPNVIDGNIAAQAFDLFGKPDGNAFPVNTQTAGFQNSPSVAGLRNGGFTIVWTDLNAAGDGSGLSVKAQHYQQDASAHLPSNDFNADGRSDILWREASGFVAEWQMNGDQVISNTGVASPGNDWKFQDTGDFGGDGFSDVMWRHLNGQVVLWHMNGDQIVLNTSVQVVSNDYHIQGVGDFNGDHKSDVLWRHDSGQVVLWQMDGHIITANTAIAVPSRQYHIEGVGDFNGDGKSDVLFRHDSGQVILWMMDGDKIVSNTAVGEVSQQYRVQGVGDFNRDGKSDVLWRHESGQVILWQMDGDKVLSNTAIANVSNDYKIQDVRDYNIDGMSDVLFRHDSGQVVLWQMNADRIVSNTEIQTVPNNWTIQVHHFDLV